MELTNPEIGINHSVPNAVMGLSMNQCFPMNSRKIYVSEKLYNELLDDLANIFEQLKGIWPNKKLARTGLKGGLSLQQIKLNFTPIQKRRIEILELKGQVHTAILAFREIIF